MASKRKINQDDLRKMLAKVKTGPGGGAGAQSSISKRYKLSSRELALMEEQKRQQEERKRLKEAHIKAFQAKLPPAPPPEAKPQKSILKNTAAYVPPIMIPSNISISASTQNDSSVKFNNLKPENNLTSISLAENEKSSIAKETEENKPEMDNNLAPNLSKQSPESSINTKAHEIKSDTGENDMDVHNSIRDSNLPEGFFDDPVQDAKARNVPYVDVEEEEWERFQKEIGEEMSTAQTILVEDREEATADRQIEEIDEQMEAWRRVSKMEQMKDQVHIQKNNTHSKCATKSNETNLNDTDSSEGEGDFEEFVSWRRKR